MILIWQGWGILSLFIPVAFGLLMNPLGELGLGIGLLLGAVVNFYVGYKLNNRQSRVYVDSVTGEHFVFRRNNSLFWIPMQYISIPWVLLSIFEMLHSYSM